MLDDLQRLFRESLATFRAELAKREPEDEIADLLAGMRREVKAARAALPALEAELQAVRAELGREREQLELCERRGTQAERIGDAETVRVAAEFAARHRARVRVLEQKAAAAQAELELRGREAEEMQRRYTEADANRFALLAQLRRVRAQERMRERLDGSGGTFADFARMEEAVERNAAYAESVGEVVDVEPPPAPSPEEVEARLRELKRRMGRE